jgi:hypothetical protein
MKHIALSLVFLFTFAVGCDDTQPVSPSGAAQIVSDVDPHDAGAETYVEPDAWKQSR